MKKFRFQLQPILRYREYLEHMAKIDVAQAQMKVDACEADIANSEETINHVNCELDREMMSGIDANRLHYYSAFLTGMADILEKQMRRREVLVKEKKEKQDVLAQKAVGRKVMENVKERRKEEYYENVIKTMQKETDDTIIVRKAREIQS